MSSLNLRRSLTLGLLLGGLAACGFTPIAATGGKGDAAARPKISDLVVKSDDPRFTYHLRRRLLQSVDINVTSAPRLETTTSISSQGLAISDNDAITRFTYRTETAYRLGRTDQKPIAAGVATNATSVNATASQFTTQINERDALKRIAEDTADRLVNILRLHRGK